MSTTSESTEGGVSTIKEKEEIDSLAYTRWNCKYHIVFAPKYRRQAIYGQVKAEDKIFDQVTIKEYYDPFYERS